MFRSLLFTSCLVLSAAAWGQAVPTRAPPLGFDAAVAQAVRVAPPVNARQAQAVAAREEAVRRIEEAHALTAAEQLAVSRAAAQAWVNLWAAEREAGELRQLRSQTAI